MSLRASQVCLLALAACLLLPGCRAGEQAEQANRRVDELNALKDKAAQLTNRAGALDEELRRKDPETEGDDILRLAQEEAELLRQSAALYRQAADVAEQASRLRIEDWFREYLTLKAQQLRKQADYVDAVRGQADVLVRERDLDAVNRGRAEAADRAEAVNRELEGLTRRLNELEQAHKADIQQ